MLEQPIKVGMVLTHKQPYVTYYELTEIDTPSALLEETVHGWCRSMRSANQDQTRATRNNKFRFRYENGDYWVSGLFCTPVDEFEAALLRLNRDIA